MLTIIEMATIRNFEVMSWKFNVSGICTRRIYTSKWITEMCNY